MHEDANTAPPPSLSPDRFRGALLGLAAGDAVGTSVEFKRRGTFPPLTDMVGGGPFALPVGAWTDDTSTALCLATSLVEQGGFDAIDQLTRYCRWWKDGYLSSTGHCFDIGTTTSRVLGHFLRTGNATPPFSEEDAANGSIMRLAPVALRYASSIEEAIERAAGSSRTTHPAARPVDGCRLLAALVVGALQGRSKEELLAPGYWQWGTLDPAIAAIARGSYRDRTPDTLPASGYVVDTLEAALWALATNDTFAAGALAAANLGNDADTTGAVYGQLAGALCGAEGIPAAWRSKLVMHDQIVSLADQLRGAALTTTRVPARRRAVAMPLPDSYRVSARLLAGGYPGAPTRRDAERKLHSLLDAGITAIIDLTEHGELIPYETLLGRIAAETGHDVRHLRHPIRDLSIPSDRELAAILDELDELIAAGESVYVHCWGGVGRTGTVIACHLIRRDRLMAGDEALATLASLRQASRKRDRIAPETPDQRALVRRWANEAARSDHRRSTSWAVSNMPGVSL